MSSIMLEVENPTEKENAKKEEISVF